MFSIENTKLNFMYIPVWWRPCTLGNLCVLAISLIAWEQILLCALPSCSFLPCLGKYVHVVTILQVSGKGIFGIFSNFSLHTSPQFHNLHRASFAPGKTAMILCDVCHSSSLKTSSNDNRYLMKSFFYFFEMLRGEKPLAVLHSYIMREHFSLCLWWEPALIANYNWTLNLDYPNCKLPRCGLHGRQESMDDNLGCDLRLSMALGADPVPRRVAGGWAV